MEAHRTTQTSRNKSHQPEIPDAATGAGAALQLVKSRKIICLIRVPAVESYQSNSKRIIGTGEANLRSRLHRPKRRFAVESIDEWRVSQIARRHREKVGHC